MLIINIITRKNLGAFRQESTPQSAPNHIRGTLCRSLTSGGADDKQVRESPALLPPDTDDETDGCQSATTHGH